jgi:hypothetical protein
MNKFAWNTDQDVQESTRSSPGGDALRTGPAPCRCDTLDAFGSPYKAITAGDASMVPPGTRSSGFMQLLFHFCS